MMVPRTRLIVLAAIVLLPASLAAAANPSWTFRAGVAAFCLALVAVADARAGRKRFEGVAVAVPAIVRMTVDRSADIQITVNKPASLTGNLRIGLPLPDAVASRQDDLNIFLTDTFDTVRLQWPCRAKRRGRYLLERCYLELLSGWKLWAVRKRFAVEGEIRIYPNLAVGQRSLNGLFRRNELGMRINRKVGKGREFEQLREYLPGDSYEDIDWKATARRRFPITKVFQVEQAQEIYVVLDASRLSTRNVAYLLDRRERARADAAETRTTIFERYVTAALVMALAAEQTADRYGLFIFSDTPECFLKAGRGQAHYNACREALYNRMPRRVSPDFDEVFAYLGARVRKRSLLVFLTSLDDPALTDNFQQAMTAAARRHILLVNMIRPAGAYPLFSSDDVSTTASIYRHLAGHMLWSALADNRRRFKQHGVGFNLLDKEMLCSQLVSQYMDVKQRQIL